MLEQSSAMDSATNCIMTAPTTHPQTEPAGPEYARLYDRVEATEGSSPRTEKDTEKDDHIEKSLHRISGLGDLHLGFRRVEMALPLELLFVPKGHQYLLVLVRNMV